MVQAELLRLLQGHFGSKAVEILTGELGKLGASSADGLLDEQKTALAKSLLENYFNGVVSGMKIRMITSQLYMVLGISEQQSTAGGDMDGMI